MGRRPEEGAMVWLRLGALIAALALLASCASGGAEQDVSREMEIGYKAARRGYWQEALLRFDRAVTLSPGDGEALNNLAVALEVTGRYDAARETYEQALAAAPRNKRIQQNQKRFQDFYETFIVDAAAAPTAVTP